MAITAKQEQFSDDELEGLGPDELKALRADDESDDDDGYDEEPDDSGDEEDGSDDDEADDSDSDDQDGDEEEPKDTANDDSENEGDDEDEDVDDETEVDLPAASKLPRYNIDENDVRAATSELEKIKTDSKTLKTKFSEGDITEDEYHDQMEDLNDRKYEARRTIDHAEQLKVHNETNAGKEWEITQEAFYSMEGNEVFRKPAIQASLQLFLDQVANDEANAKKSNLQLLIMAGKLVRKEFKAASMPLASPKVDKRTPAQKELDKRRQRRERATDDIDKTLSNKTKAGDSDGNYKGKFAHLEDLAGGDLEEALASMSESDQEAWLTK